MPAIPSENSRWEAWRVGSPFPRFFADEVWGASRSRFSLRRDALLLPLMALGVTIPFFGAFTPTAFCISQFFPYVDFNLSFAREWPDVLTVLF